MNKGAIVFGFFVGLVVPYLVHLTNPPQRARAYDVVQELELLREQNRHLDRIADALEKNLRCSGCR